MAKGKK